MTTALMKALNQSRANYNLAYQQGVNLKASGVSFFDVGPVGMGASQFGQFQSDAANRRRYQSYRGWVYSAIHALAKKGAGQAVNLGTTNEKETDKPGKTKAYIINKMTQIARSKAAEEEVKVIYNHPFLKALEHPNSIQSRWQFVYSFIANLCLTGWSYVVADDVGEEGYQFYSVPTTWVRPIHTKGPFAEFKIVNPNNPASYDDNTPPLDRSRVAFAYIPDPSNMFGALAPTKAQDDAVKIDDFIQSSQQVFFQNGIFPSVILTIGNNPFNDATGSGGVRPRLNAAQRRQINAAINKVSRGIANYGNPAIIDGMIEKIERLSATSNEMGWEKSEKTNRTRLLSAFGVHPFILGEAVPGSYAQSYNVEKVFFENVNTYLDMLGSCMSHFAGVLTGDENLMVWWDACRPIDPAQEALQWNQGRSRDDITQNEWRAWMDLPPDEDKNQNIIGKAAKEVMAVAAQVKGGQLTPEQGQAILIGMGLPDDAAKKIAGDGPSEEDKARMAAQQQPPQTPGQPGQKPGSEQQNKEDQKPGKPKKPEEKIEEQIQKALDLLSKPVVIDVKDVEDQVDLILKNCGAGAPGSPGFQPGNTCARGGGGFSKEKIESIMSSISGANLSDGEKPPFNSREGYLYRGFSLSEEEIRQFLKSGKISKDQFGTDLSTDVNDAWSYSGSKDKEYGVVVEVKLGEGFKIHERDNPRFKVVDGDITFNEMTRMAVLKKAGNSWGDPYHEMEVDL